MRVVAKRCLRTMLGSLLVAASVGAVLVSTTPAGATTSVTLYVTTGGTATTVCTSSHPCPTIQDAVTAAQTHTGDIVTITVAAGTYPGGITIAASGLASLSIHGAGSATTTVTGGGTTRDVLVTIGTVTIDGLAITHGEATTSGGGVHNAGTLTLTNDTVSNDHATYGGGVSNLGTATLTLTNDTFTNDSASRLGGGVFNSGTATLTNNTLTNDSALFDGGGVYNSGTATLTNNTFINDGARLGGALANFFGTATLTNDTLSNDSATTGGSGVYSGDTPTLSATTRLTNSIVDSTSCAGAPVTGSDNVVTTLKCRGSGPTVVTTPAAIDLATTLAANTSSGPQTLAIGPTSAAYHEVPLSNCTVVTDERGLPRPGAPGACDAGAYEYQAPSVTLYVATTGTATTGCTTSSAPCHTIQEGVNAAEQFREHLTVTVAAGTYTGGITIAASALASLSLHGAGSATTIVTGHTRERVFFVTSGTVTMSGLTITHGYADGAGIYNTGTLTLSEDTVSYDTGYTSSFGGGAGGGVYNSGTLTLTSDTVTYDTSDTGGGVYNNTGTLTLTNDTVSHDTARGNGGGGVYNLGTATLTNDTLSNDTAHTGFTTAGGGHGGVVNNRGTITLTSDTLSNDSATTGGGVFSFGTATLTSDTLANDRAVNGGGVSNYGTAALTNDTLTNDSASYEGGGVFSFDTATLTSDTLANDRAGSGGGVYNTTTTPRFGTLTLTNSIVDAASCAGPSHAGSDNVVTTPTCRATSTGSGPTVVTTPAVIDLATALAANTSSGPQTLAIGPNSAAYHEVPLSHCTVTTDERGLPRPGAPGACDAGAYEYQSPPPPPPPPPPPVHVARIFGQTPAGTAVAVLETAFSPAAGDCPGTASTRPVVLATDESYPDALVSAYLAKDLGTGTLVTPGGALLGVTLAGLSQEGITHVFVVGGPLAVSTAVITALEHTAVSSCGGGKGPGTDITVTRIFGKTAYETAQQVALSPGTGFPHSVDLSGAYGSVNPKGGTGTYNTTAGNASSKPASPGALRTAIVTTGTGFQDAMVASGLSYATDLPILLTTPGSLSPEAATAIRALGITQVLIMGGPLAVSDAVVSELEAMGVSVLRVAGSDYSATAVELADMELASKATSLGLGWKPTGGVTVARGDFYADGLAGALAAAGGGPSFAHGPEPLLLTTNPTTVGRHLGALLENAGARGIDDLGDPVTSLTLLGGPRTITTSTVHTMVDDLGP